MRLGLLACVMLFGCGTAPPPKAPPDATCAEVWSAARARWGEAVRIDGGGERALVEACKVLGDDGVACFDPQAPALERGSRAVGPMLSLSCLMRRRATRFREDDECDVVLRHADDLVPDEEGRVSVAGLPDVQLSRRPDGRVWLFVPEMVAPFDVEGLVCGSAPFVPSDFEPSARDVRLADVPFPARVIDELDPRWLRVR